jgi:hypothetical protein
MIVILALAVYLGICFWVGKTAEGKGRRFAPWVFLAALIGVFAFIPLLIAGPSHKGLLRRQPSSPGHIKELSELHEAGVLTTAEFEAKKADLLDRL